MFITLNYGYFALNRSIQARRFWVPLVRYLNSRLRTAQNAQAQGRRIETKVWAIGRSVFWLTLSGLCILLSIPFFAFGVIAVFLPTYRGANLLPSIIGYVFLRIGASYSKVKFLVCLMRLIILTTLL